MEGNCPCPNLVCPNYGDCKKCTGSHIRKGYLSYCAFHTILPTLEQLIKEDPNSPMTEKLQGYINPQLQAYQDLMKKHGVSETECKRRLKKTAEYGSS